MTDKEAMRMALEALENERYVTKYTHIVEAITALRAQLEQIEQIEKEPAAYWIPKADQFCIADPRGRPFAKAWEPLYTSPPAAQRKPLTIDQLRSVLDHCEDNRIAVARAIEAAHGIGEKP